MASFTEAAKAILFEAKSPLNYKEITRRALARGLVQTKGLTPHDTMGTAIRRDIAMKKADSDFIKVGDGVFYLNIKRISNERREQFITN